MRRILLPLLILLAALPAIAHAAPRFNPANRMAQLPIEGYGYDRAKGCNGKVQPGTLSLQNWLARNARGVSWGIENCRTISKPACKVIVVEKRGEDGKVRRKRKKRCEKPSWSLHAEGRALDWHLDVRDKADRREASRLIEMLLDGDVAGNPHALARRMGIQEIIWDCKAWFSGMEEMVPTRRARASAT